MNALHVCFATMSFTFIAFTIFEIKVLRDFSYNIGKKEFVLYQECFGQNLKSFFLHLKKKKQKSVAVSAEKSRLHSLSVKYALNKNI